MAKYTSKTSNEIETIIANLENEIINIEKTGQQKIQHNGTVYEVRDFIKSIDYQIQMWVDRLEYAYRREGKSKVLKRFTRYEGYL